LEWIIQHETEFDLRTWERNQLGDQLSLALIRKARPASDSTAQFISTTLDAVETPAGLLHNRSWVQRELQAGAEAIAACRNHRPPRCACWRSARERLWYFQDYYGGKSPESWAATRLWELFEQMEQAARPERIAGLGTPPP
jgi:hypothetical protein